MNNQTALDQHHAIFVATLDYLLEQATHRVIIDQRDDARAHYEKLKQQAEKHYRNGNLPLLQSVIQEIDGNIPIFKDESFLTSIKDRTGYEAEIVKQSLPAGRSKRKSEVVTINDPVVAYKKLAELISPDNKRKIIVRETSRPPHLLMTSVDLQFERSGASVYMVDGVDLDIHVYWKDNNTVIIETRADYVARSRHGEQYRCLDDVVRVEYVVR